VTGVRLRPPLAHNVTAQLVVGDSKTMSHLPVVQVVTK
jgi:hypothetical protein